jgi:uncharacterized membrane protein YoaK (UPF0700 family)
MSGYGRSAILLAACLAALGGFVDATGYLSLGGYFVAFMSGNSTRLAVGLAQSVAAAGTASALIAAFVLGGAAGFLAGHFAGPRQRVAVLALVALLLGAAAVVALTATALPAVLIAAAAMGAENACFQRKGEVSIGLTYMTGALVKVGQRLGAAAVGGEPLAWLPHFLLWLSLMIGAFTGAAAFPLLGLNALWLASAAAAALAVMAAVIGPGPNET